MKKAIVIGASSGIGKALTIALLSKGFYVGITGRRRSALEDIQQGSPEAIKILEMDVQQIDLLDDQCEALVQQLGGLDLFIICSGIGEMNKDLNSAIEQQVIQTNISGFTQLATWAFRHFQQQGKGHLVNISSIAGLRGNPLAPSYNASKSYQINYMEGLQMKAFKSRLPIYVTDIRPGFVDTAMAKGEGLFWVAPVDKAAKQMIMAIEHKKRVAYITRRWGLIAALLKRLPFAWYKRM